MKKEKVNSLQFSVALEMRLILAWNTLIVDIVKNEKVLMK